MKTFPPERTYFLLSFCFFLIFIPMGNLPSDTEYSVATAASICEGKLSVEPTGNLPHLKAGRNGLSYSKYGIAYAFLFTPAAFLAKTTATVIPVEEIFLLYGLAVFTNTIIASFTILLFFRLFRKMGYSGKIILLSIISIAAGSILLPYSKITHSEIPTTALLLVFLLRMLSGENLDIKNGNIYGLISSALILLKPGNVIYSGCIIGWGIYLIIRRRVTPAGVATLLFWPAAAVLIMAGLNIYRFGNIFDTGYGAEQSAFTTPLLTGLGGLLFSPSKSLFLFSPLVILCILSIYSAWKKYRNLTAMVLLMFLGNLLFYSKWHDWHGGWCWGPRLILPSLIITHIFLPEFISKLNKGCLKKALFVSLLSAAVIINLTGALVWYQQIYYFHTDHRTVTGSHLIIAEKLLINKLQGKPEIYSCSDFKSYCSSIQQWNNFVDGDKIDFSDFQTFQGFSTLWSGLARNYGLNFMWIMPVLLLLFVISIGFLQWKQLTGLQKLNE